jgi:hypothetical protein
MTDENTTRDALAAEWWDAVCQIARAALTIASADHQRAILSLEPHAHIENTLSDTEGVLDEIAAGIAATRTAARPNLNENTEHRPRPPRGNDPDASQRANMDWLLRRLFTGDKSPPPGAPPKENPS